MLACQLARFGVPFVIVDRKAGPTTQSRALVVHARSLELYDGLGIGEEAVSLGRQVTGIRLFVRGRPVEGLSLVASGQEETAHPYLLVLEQSRNEALLQDCLQRGGGSVRWRTTVEAVSPDASGVDVQLQDADGNPMHWRCDWVIGCDGARSLVRKACGLRFTGGTYRNEFYVVDARVDGDLPRDEVVPSLSHDAFALFVPMPGERRYRVVGAVPASPDAPERPPNHDDDDEDEDEDEHTLLRATPASDAGQLTYSAIESAIRNRVDVDIRLSDVDWFATYRVHHRCVERFRHGRCLLAGDSAHVHSPVGGQGMNTGLQDAANLGWKLALVVQGRASDALLDSYHEERWPVAQSLLRTTDNAFRLVVTQAAPVRTFRMQVLPHLVARLLERPGLRRALFRRLSQIGIAYRRSLLVDAADAVSVDRLFDASPEVLGGPVLRAGDRLPFAVIKPPLSHEPMPVHRWLAAPGFNVLLLDRHGDPAVHMAACAQELAACDLGPMRIRAVPHGPGSEALYDALGVQDEALVVVRPDQHIGLILSRIDAPHLSDWFQRALHPVLL